MTEDFFDYSPSAERERIKQGFRDLIGRLEGRIEEARQAARQRHQDLFRKMADEQLASDPRPVCTRLRLPACRKATCGLSYCPARVIADEADKGAVRAPAGPDDAF